MTLTKAVPIRNAAPTPLDGRLADMAGVVANADGSARTGVLGGGAPSILTALATMHVAVAAAAFVTSKGKADGVAIFSNDGTVNVAIDAAPASNSRIDVIYVKHNDDTTGDADALPTFGVAKGTAAAVPAKPSIPTGAEELGTLRVYAGTTAANGGTNSLTNTFKMTAARGGVVPFRTKAELDGWTTATVGQEALVLADIARYIWTGSTWLLAAPYAEAAGSYTVSALASGAFSSANLVFPTGRFTVAPLVFLQPGSARYGVSPLNITTAGFEAFTQNFSPASPGTTTTTYWRAVQMTAASAAG